MVESDLKKVDPLVEIAIYTGDSAEDAVVEQLLETLEAEEIIKRTLQAVRIQQPQRSQ